jgi:predicted amino acid dehydrogenase
MRCSKGSDHVLSGGLVRQSASVSKAHDSVAKCPERTAEACKIGLRTKQRIVSEVSRLTRDNVKNFVAQRFSTFMVA